MEKKEIKNTLQKFLLVNNSKKINKKDFDNIKKATEELLNFYDKEMEKVIKLKILLSLKDIEYKNNIKELYKHIKYNYIHKNILEDAFREAEEDFLYFKEKGLVAEAVAKLEKMEVLGRILDESQGEKDE